MNGFRRRSGSRSPRVIAVLVALFLPVRALAQTPTVVRVLPAFGPVSGNNIVIVAGTNFQGGATVTFGGTPAYPIVAHPLGITLGPDGQLWLAGCPASGGGSGVCGRFSTSGQLMSFPVPNPDRCQESVPPESWPGPTGTCGSSSTAAW
jgi:IPT/TIG domain